MHADTKLYHGEKYLVTEAMINSFTWQMNLTVKNLHKTDFAPYTCSSENALGKSDARIRLQGKQTNTSAHCCDAMQKSRKINFRSAVFVIASSFIVKASGAECNSSYRVESLGDLDS